MSGWSTVPQAQAVDVATRRANLPTVQRLRRPRVHRIELCELGYFVLGYRRWALEHEPGYAFAARRRREGASKGVIRSRIGRQQIRSVDLNCLRGIFLSFCGGRLFQSVSTACWTVRYLSRTASTRLFVGVLVHEVCNHVGALAVYCFFAGLVEVKLNELVALAFNGDGTAKCVVHLDGMPVIDDRKRRRLVIEHDGRQIGLLRDAVAHGYRWATATFPAHMHCIRTPTPPILPDLCRRNRSNDARPLHATVAKRGGSRRCRQSEHFQYASIMESPFPKRALRTRFASIRRLRRHVSVTLRALQA